MTAAAVVTPDASGAKNVGNNNATQFIPGGCVSNADCASHCCANNSQGLGVCSGNQVGTANDKQGCGFVDPTAQEHIAAAQAQVKAQGFKKMVKARLAHEN